MLKAFKNDYICFKGIKKISNTVIRQQIIDTEVNRLFSDIQFKNEPAELYNPLRYMIAIGGKRLRPRLCLTAYALYKDEFGPEILEPAAGLEVFHSFTLIHDDIMDRSPLRRGVDTVWKKWDGDTAILSGDVMCIDSYSRMTKAPKEVVGEVMALFSKTAAEVCEGQQYDMEFEKLRNVPMDDYMNMIGLKTGALLACSAKMGALIADAPEEECDRLYKYGYNLGLAFQVTDDYLDAYGDEKVFGKPIGGDILNAKKSWLTVRAWEKADEKHKAKLEEAMGLRAVTEEEEAAKIAAVKTIYNELGVDEDAKRAIIDLTERALEYAKGVGTGLCFEVLRRFADRLVGRTS